MHKRQCHILNNSRVRPRGLSCIHSTSAHNVDGHYVCCWLQVVRAELETQVVVTAVNATCLALGRWAFMPLMRANAEKAGPPMQNGVSHYDAGDTRAQEASFITSTNDPAGFTLVDTLLWGSVGHALAFIVLATNASLRVG